MNPHVEKLPKWKGFPIPFFVTYFRDGTPDFKITDTKKREWCALKRLCWVCGDPLEHLIAFLGGPVSTQHRLYNDGPMHVLCAQDALEICPFLIGQMDYGNFRADLHDDEENTKFVTGEKRPAHLKPPEDICLLLTRGFKIYDRPDIGAWFFYADQPVATQWHKRKPAK